MLVDSSTLIGQDKDEPAAAEWANAVLGSPLPLSGLVEAHSFDFIGNKI